MTKDQTSPSEQLAQALLLEQVRYYQQILLSNQPSVHIDPVINIIIQSSAKLRLEQVVELEQLQSVVQRYALDMQLGSGLLEFIGEIAKQIYFSLRASDAYLNDFVSDAQFEIWLTKFLELEQIRPYLNAFFQNSPSIKTLCHYIALNTLENQLPAFLQQPERFRNKNSNSLQARLLNFTAKQQLKLEQTLEAYLANFIQSQLTALTIVSNDDLEDLIRHIWHDLKQNPIEHYASKIEAIDIEEFFVLIYEYWKELRRKPFMQQLILYGVEVFYDFYKTHNLSEMLKSVGLTQQDIHIEILRFYPKIIQTLLQENLLEPILTSILSPFYIRPETLSVIEQHQVSSH